MTEPLIPPKIQLTTSPEYRENYANSVQLRANLWDFFLLFGILNQSTPEAVSIQNFQGIYLSPAAGQGALERAAAEPAAV